MWKMIFVGLAILITAPAISQPKATDILGRWRNGDATAVIEFSAKANKYHGKIVWLKEPIDPETGKAKTDKNNPDENARAKTILGLTIAWGFTYDADDEAWEKGRIYDPKNGKTYDCQITLKDNKTMRVRGYVLGMPFLGRTETWVRQ